MTWDFGPLRCLIASPAFHRWHHTSEDEGLDRNFAGLFPWMDLLFGTFYLPSGKQPSRFGVSGQNVPSTFVGQMLYPLRRKLPERNASGLSIILHPSLISGV